MRRVWIRPLLLLVPLSLVACPAPPDESPTPDPTLPAATPTTAAVTPTSAGATPTAQPTPGGTPALIDGDGDGYGPGQGDCDDGDTWIHPGANEVCNGDDDDCDGRIDEGRIWYDDYDEDHYGDDDMFLPYDFCDLFFNEGAVADDSDCDDGDAAIHPGAQEVCDPLNEDEDCDGVADDADPSVDPSSGSLWYGDADGDGYGAGEGEARCDPPGDGYADEGGDCDDGDGGRHPGAAEVCDGADQDCDEAVDEGVVYFADEDGDGYGDDGHTVEGCDGGGPPAGAVAVGGDCDDGDALVNPEAPDAVCDGVDDDCDGDADDGYQPQAGCGVGLCGEDAAPSSCAGGVETACQPAVPAALDASCDGVDDDCDGESDEDYAPALACGVGACADTATASSCEGGVEEACQPGAPASEDATCDQIDDDCDGRMDEDCGDRCVDLPGEVEALELCPEGCSAGPSLLGTQQLGFRPGGIAFDGAEPLLTDFDGDRVVESDGEGGWQTRFELDLASPTGLTVHGSELMVASITDDRIQALDATSGALQRTLSGVWSAPRDLASSGGRLWAADRDRGTLVEVDPTTGALVSEVGAPFSDLAGVAFCEGIPIASSRSSDEVGVIDMSRGVVSTRRAIAGISDPYGLECQGTTLWVADLDGEALHTAQLPITVGALDGDSPTGSQPLPHITREGCAPFALYELDRPVGTVVDVIVAAQDIPLGVVVLTGEGEALYGKQLAAGEVVALPDLVFGEAAPWYVEITALTPEAEGHYALWATERPAATLEVRGTVYGDGDPLEGAQVSLSSDDYLIRATTDADGAYSLRLPSAELPSYVVLGASADRTDPGATRYSPSAEQVSTSGGAKVVDFYLSSSGLELPIPGASEVIHLGDGHFSGTVNSQFQRDPVGTEVSFEFELDPARLALDRVELSLLSKGAEYFGNTITLNGVQVGALRESPSDGSYGEVRFPIWADLLQEGNVLTVSSSVEASDPDDHDDFEIAYLKLSFGEAQRYDALGSFFLPAGLGPLGLSWWGDALYVVADEVNRLYLFDLDTYAFSAGPSYGPYLTGIDAEGDVMWAANVDSDTFAAYQMPAFTYIDDFESPGTFARDVEVVGDALWAVDKDLLLLYELDRATGELLDSSPLSGAPAAVAFQGDELWLSDRDAHTISVYDGVGGELLHTLEGVRDPYALDPHDGIMWAVSREESRIWAFLAP